MRPSLRAPLPRSALSRVLKNYWGRSKTPPRISRPGSTLKTKVTYGSRRLSDDSLLVTVGIFSAGRFIHMPLKWLLLSVMLCAIVGDQIGYWIGRSAGAALYRREESFFFRRSHLQHAHDFYEKYGGRAVILARFIPIVRTFCPPVAGAAKMPYSSYVAFDICGGIFWVATMILAGYTLGRSVPNIGARIHYVIAVVIVVSVLPAVISIYHSMHKFSASGDQSSAATPRAEGK